MNLLAIETSSNACSVALAVDGDVSTAHVVEPRAHTRILMPMISKILQDAKLDTADLDAVVLGNGPGSFIGMRIGASVAQGICFAAGLKIIPVSSLAAVAAEALTESEASHVAVVQDARMQEVYVGKFVRDEQDLPAANGEESICAVGDLELEGDRYLAAGDGWRRYPELMQFNQSQILARSDVLLPSARHLIPLARQSADVALAPEALVPAYLRQKAADVPRSSR